jgi:hypothetical protein
MPTCDHQQDGQRAAGGTWPRCGTTWPRLTTSAGHSADRRNQVDAPRPSGGRSGWWRTAHPHPRGLATARLLAAQRYGAAEIVDPRPYAVGSIAETPTALSPDRPVLPAMGYAPPDRETAATIAATPCDLLWRPPRRPWPGARPPRRPCGCATNCARSARPDLGDVLAPARCPRRAPASAGPPHALRRPWKMQKAPPPPPVDQQCGRPSYVHSCDQTAFIQEGRTSWACPRLTLAKTLALRPPRQ